MQRSILAKRLCLLLFAAACVTYLYGLGGLPLVGADEPRYAQVAREMYARGDLVTPTLGGLHWFEKPPLLYWMMIAAYAAAGVSEFAARLGPALSGLACVLSAGLLARTLEGRGGEAWRWTGLSVAGVLASSVGVLVFSRGASFDIVLTACVAFALSCFLAAEVEEDGRRRRRLLAGFYVGVGLATLAKGLAGVVLPGGVVASYFLLRRRWPRLTRLGVWWGAPLSLAVAAAWYGPALARHGYEFVDEFIVQHHFARYVSNKFHHPEPFFYYLYMMPLLALPWTLFLGGALWDLKGRVTRRETPEGEEATEGKSRRETTESNYLAFALAWLAFPVVFFSFSGSKLPGYVLPALPGAALLAGWRLARYVRGGGGGGEWLMRATGLGALGLGVFGVAYARTGASMSLSLAASVAAPSVAAGLLALTLAKTRRGLCAASLVAGAFLTVALIMTVAAGSFAGVHSVKGLLREADARGYGALPLLQLHDIERTSEFYGAGRISYQADGQPTKLEGPYEVLREAGARGGRALVIVPLEFLYQLEKLQGAETTLVGDNGFHALVYVEVVGR